MKKSIILISLSLMFLSNSAIAKLKVKITGTQSGEFVSSLIDTTEPANNKTVGTFKTKKEARKAGRAAKKEAESVIAIGCENVGQVGC